MSVEEFSEPTEPRATLPLPGPQEPDTPNELERIGPYRLLRLLGEGGMGEVWLAQQTEPVRRSVALKIIKLGMDTRQVVARFEVERQALALMEHPGIAKIFDGGATAQGRPYFVMEYVAGIPITNYCDRFRLSTTARVRLMMEVCDAVQHAHQKAVIHRDLKPSNILVLENGGEAHPRVIDFGIAKATGQALTDRTLVTEAGGFVGTPEYMSPEQADRGGQEVDTRTDIFSLGVVLYELLTGTLPLSSKELRSSTDEELRLKLRELAPPRPSARVGRTASIDELARDRSTDPGSLGRELKGDLDAIVIKAVEKDRARRYATVSELALDLGRFLRHEPVIARPPRASYLLAKYIRRHSLAVSLAGLAILLVGGFTGALAVQLDRVRQERDRANAWADYVSSVLTAKPTVSPPEARARPRNLKEQEAILRDAARVFPDGFQAIRAKNELVENLIAQRRYEEAEELATENLDSARHLLGPAHSLSSWATMRLIEARALAGKSDAALSLLETSVKEGLFYRSFNLEHDTDLSSIRNHPRFKALMVWMKERGR